MRFLVVLLLSPLKDYGMKKENSCLRRFWILFRRRLRHYRRLLEKNWRKVKAWFGRRVAALKASDDYGVRFVRETPWRKFRSILLLLVAFVVLGGSFVPGLLCWFGELWNSEDMDGIYYLRSPLITAGAALLAASIAAGFFAWRNWIAGKQLKNTNKQLAYTNEQLKNAQTSLQEERYKKGVELLGHASQVVRIGGLYALHQLAEDFPKEWALPVMELMCIFVRTPPLDKDKPEEIGEKPLRRELQEAVPFFRSEEKPLRRDVQEAVQLLGIRSLARREEEKRERDKAKEGGIGKSPGGGELDFHGADLAGGSWKGVDLGGANFWKAKLEDANFWKATLDGADFRWATLTDAKFEGATLTGANFYGATLTRASFFESTLPKARFIDTKLEGAIFWDAILTGASFEGSKIPQANFWKSKLEGAIFLKATLPMAYFGEATLTRAILYRAMLEKADFSGRKLEGANFIRATLTGAFFSGAELEGADFEEAALSAADIAGANLTRANLSGAILLVHKTIMGKAISDPVKGATREQLEAGWIEEGRPPVKVVEEEDAHGRPTRTTMTLTEADWKELGLDAPPRLRQGPPPGWRRNL